MNKPLKQLIRQRVREFNNQSMTIAKNDQTIEPGLVFHSGFRATAPAAPDMSRKLRRVFERRMMKQLAAKGVL